MAFTAQDVEDVARLLVQKSFVSDGNTAHSDWDAVKAAVQAIDDAMNATTNAASTAYPATVMKVALLNFARTGAANLTVAEGALALAYWAMREGGLA